MRPHRRAPPRTSVRRCRGGRLHLDHLDPHIVAVVDAFERRPRSSDGVRQRPSRRIDPVRRHRNHHPPGSPTPRTGAASVHRLVECGDRVASLRCIDARPTTRAPTESHGASGSISCRLSDRSASEPERDPHAILTTWDSTRTASTTRRPSTTPWLWSACSSLRHSSPGRSSADRRAESPPGPPAPTEAAPTSGVHRRRHVDQNASAT